MVDFIDYSNNPKFYVVVDCIIFGYSEDKLKILVRQFNTGSEKMELRLHGGFVQENEDLDDVAQRIIRERTGVDKSYTEQVGTWGKRKRDPKDRVISVAYYSLLDIAKCDKKKIAHYNSMWVDIDTLPQLQLDHADMVNYALFQLRMFVGRKPIGFSLLHRQERPDRQAAQQTGRRTLSLRRGDVQVFQQLQAVTPPIPLYIMKGFLYRQ